MDEVVGGLAHGADHGHDLGALPAGPGDVVGHGTDPVGVADRGAPEFLDDQWHPDEATDCAPARSPRGASRRPGWPWGRLPGRRSEAAPVDWVGSRAVPSDKRARQRAAREARLAAEAQSQKRRKQIRNGIIVVVIAGGDRRDRLPGLRQQQQRWPPQSNVRHDDHHRGRREGADAKLQAQANEVGGEGGLPGRTQDADGATRQKYTAAPAMTIDTSKTYTATFKTTTGTFDASLDATAAPKTVNNFVFLANKGYYHCGASSGSSPASCSRPATRRRRTRGRSPATPSPTSSRPRRRTRRSSTRWARWSWPTRASPTGRQPVLHRLGAAGRGPAQHLLPLRPGHVRHERRRHHQQTGLGRGIPPDVTQRIISLTINES